MNKFRAGDKVKITDRDKGMSYWNSEPMDLVIGKVCTIEHIISSQFMGIRIKDRGVWYFHENTLDKLGQMLLDFMEE